MGQYGITGWSGGARVPLTYNLRAGQMRGMGRVNVFPNNTYVNNNFYGSNYDYGCSCNSNSTPGWMNWMMGIGLGGSLLGGILGMFAKKDDSAEGAGGEKKTTEASKELSKLEQAQNSIKGLGKEYSVKSDADGNITFEFKTKDGHVYSGKTLGELNQAVYDAINKPATTEVKPENTEKPEKAETLPKLFTNMDSFKKTEDVLNAFKSATGADATKIDDIAGTITLSQVEDKGNGTKMSGNLSIKAETLKDIEPGTTKPLGTFKGKKVIAENLDGYIRIKVGDSQTYIVGKTSNGKYQGYQFENGNVTGYNAANWTRRS